MAGQKQPGYPDQHSQSSFYYKGLSSDSRSVFPGPAAPALPKNMLEMQILRPYPRPTESESQEMGFSHLCLNEPSRYSDML